ncbi:MAG: hypothetical protein FJ033_06005 [Chloroflexi bacterium]|nr:hypothetical protein [Chloroflexota bacterium]
MWTHLRLADDLIVAEAWKEVIEDQGIPCQVWPLASDQRGIVFTRYQIVVPNDRVHVATLVVQHAE